MTEETYTVIVKCDNCRDSSSAVIAKGKRVPESVECEHCGCKTTTPVRWSPCVRVPAQRCLQ